jgi:DcaP outer membrane protein
VSFSGIGDAWAATAKGATPSTSSRLAAQQKQIDAQRAEIAAQRAAIDTLVAQIARQQTLLATQRTMADSQTVTVAAQRARLDTLETQLAETRQRLDELSSQAGLPALQKSLEERLKAVESATKKAPELPPDVVSAGDFPGSIRIPGSDAAIKFGARIRTAAVFTLDPLGTDDRFLTNSIPVGDTITSGEAKRMNISARASRLNIEFRTPGGREQVRAFFEGDFAGAGNALRLRHAYAQYIGFIVGQTWSTFSDPAANHQDLDFEGVSSENEIRQPQIRYWWGKEGGARKAVAIETPAVSITGAEGVNLFPDVVARTYIPLPKDGHIQVAGVLRQIRGQVTSGEVQTVWGGGGSVSGVVMVPVQKLSDRIIFQVNGGVGIARYINDLQSLGGQDAMYDSTRNVLKALPVLGWYVDYEHVWKEWSAMEHMNLRSTVMWSFVGVHNFDFQAADAYWKTNRLAVNAIFSPSTRVDLGIEYIFGNRYNKDGERGSANQIQVVGLFRF